jgi:DHA1 family bicyclomycin/chloramphenicol resistance-like MFS transporter
MLFFTVLLIEILSCAELDIFVPSFPQLQELFQLTPFDVELTMSANLVTYCITALMAGTMGDRYGRKPLIIIGLGIFLLGSLLCILAPSFWILLLGRGLQGMGMACPATLAYIVIADCFSVAEQQKKMGTLNGVVSLSMAIAPILGSFLTLYFGWKGNFIALFLIGCVSLVLTHYFIPKSCGNKGISLSLTQYLPVLKSKEIMLLVGIINFIVLGFWVFVGLSPILYMEDLGVPLKHFGWYQGAMAASFACISFSSPLFLKHFGQKKCFHASYMLLGVFLLLSIYLMIFTVTSPLAITAVMMVMSMGIVLPVNILWPLALGVLPEAKGRVAGIFVAFRMIFTSIGLQVVSYFYSGTVKPIAFFMVLMMIGTFVFSYKLVKVRSLFD